MPANEPQLTEELSGLQIDLSKMRAQGWCDQGASDCFSYLPQEEGLWVRELPPAMPTCGEVRLFVFLHLQAERIQGVQTAVYRVSPWAAPDEMGIPLFPPDWENAKRCVYEILARRPPAANRAEPAPLAMDKLLGLINQSIRHPDAKALIVGHRLRESFAPPGMDGSIFSATDSRLEMLADLAGQIKTIWLQAPDSKNPTGSDSLIAGLTYASTRNEVRKVLGSPTRAGENGAWERYDSAQYAIHLQYCGNGHIGRVTIMAPDVAP